MRLPLSLRLLVPIGICLVLTTGGAGWTIATTQRQLALADVDAGLDARLAWLSAVLEIEDGEIEAEFRPQPGRLAAYWAISTATGHELWQSEQRPTATQELRSQTAIVHIGLAPEDPLPAEAVRLTRTDDGYRFPPGAGLRLQLSASSDIGAILDEQHRLTLTLAGVLGGFALLTMGIIWLIVRRETGPLVRISHAAQAIDGTRPDPPALRATAGGGSREIHGLATALDEMVARLIDSVQRERRFSAAAAHELRTPLAQLIANVEVALRRPRDRDAYHAVLTEVLDDARRLADLTAGVLALVRRDGDPQASIAVTELEDLCRSTGIEPELATTGDGTRRLRGERRAIAVVVRNLVDNAHRHGGTTVRITLADDAANGGIRLRVIDDGTGIPAAERERIFQPLVRLDEARSIDGEPGGFGLGLALVQEIVHGLGGTVRCRERDDGRSGAVFEVDLPPATATASTG